MIQNLDLFNIHNHTDVSNFRLRDSINKPERLLDHALKIGLSGVVLTDHEALTNHIRAQRYLEENKERFGEFVLGFGNEIYLVDRKDTLTKKELNEKIQFNHFILIAKNQNGYEALKKLSSLAWENSFYYKFMERVPTFKDDFRRIVQEYKGDLIASSACIGGEIPSSMLEYHKDPTDTNWEKIKSTIEWFKDLFGDDLYFELQPSHNDEQNIVNKLLHKFSLLYDVKCIVSTDAHYLSKKYAKAHENYLNANDGDREVAEFYSTTYLMNKKDLLEFFEEEELTELIFNSNLIREKLQPIVFKQSVKIPKARIPEYKMSKWLEPYYDQYPYFRKFYESEYEVDRFYLHLIVEGFKEKQQLPNHENLSRINTELDEIYHITEELKQPLSSYFVLAKDLIDIMWEVSLVGVSRGSASCYYTNYLLDIVQINPIKYNLPHWRFLTKERPELPDIDIDAESSRRQEIINLTKKYYKEENVLNIGTVNTEGTRSTVLTACRGLGIDKDVAQNIANLIPTYKGGIWTIDECFNGRKNEKPAFEFIEEISKYESLDETMLAIEGLISGRSQHASGVIIFPNGYLEQNAMMKTTSGLPVTQFVAEDSVYMGGLKLDYLSINALDRIRSGMELLIEYGKIEWQGTLRKTYDKYLHPDVLEYAAPEMYDLLFNGHILNAFQFETPVGQQALNKLNARSFNELMAGNSLMRLSISGGEQPLDKFVRFKSNIYFWYEEMSKNGLSDEEMKVLEKHVLETYGVCDSQEVLMQLIMDPQISGYSLKDANKFRKAIAKQDQTEIRIQKIKFYDAGKTQGTSIQMLDYVWNFQFSPSFGYAFSKPHTAGYTLILMIEMNIAYRYGSVYWKTACLSVNSGLAGDNEGGTNYAAIAKAVGDMKGIIKNPDINFSKLSFTPLEKENEILFGLKPIVSLGPDAIDTILENRPYASFQDFYLRLVETKMLSPGKVVTLIKSGAFDRFPNCEDRRQLMIDFVKKVIVKREKLTMVQLPVIMHLIDKQKFEKELEIYDFRMKIQGRKKQKMNKALEKEFIEKFSKLVEYTFEDGELVINEKKFGKFYELGVEKLKQYLNTQEAADLFNKVKMQEFWRDNCSGTKESWEMETVLFYSDKHELDYMPIKQYFNIVSFKDLPEEPIISGFKMWRGRKNPQYKIDIIAGTVIDKTKKGLVSILTQDGVVTVRYSKGQFMSYDKKVVKVDKDKKQVLDKSWFDRGTLLVIVGFRRNDEFVPRSIGSQYQNSTFKILKYDKEKVYFQQTKIEE